MVASSPAAIAIAIDLMVLMRNEGDVRCQIMSQVIQTRTPPTAAIDTKERLQKSSRVNTKTKYVVSSPTAIVIAINLMGNESDVWFRNRHANAIKPMPDKAVNTKAAMAMTIMRPGGAIKRL